MATPSLRSHDRSFGGGGGHAACGRCSRRAAGAAHAVSTPIDGGSLRVLGSGERRVPGDPRARAQRGAARSRSARSCGATTRPATCSARPCSRPPIAARRSSIHKDRIAAVYEYTGGNKQSFFHKRVDPIRGFQAWFLGAVYRAPGSFKQRPNALAERILAHPNITVEHMRKRFDHRKVYIIDDRYLALGSMGIGDNHRHEWIDVMVEAEGEEHVARLRERMVGPRRVRSVARPRLPRPQPRGAPQEAAAR